MYYFLNDHLGTPQKIVNSSGHLVWQAVYQPFGEAQLRMAVVSCNLRFPGQYYDAESGLHYNWNRYYDPDTGRYITADPIGLSGGINLYAYVMGNPVNLSDMNGLHPVGEGWSYNESSGQWESSPPSTLPRLSPLDVYEAFLIAMFPMEAVVVIIAGESAKCEVRFTKQMLSKSVTIAEGYRIDKVAELVEKFGGKAKYWVKKKGWDEYGREWHWYENKGHKVGLKPAGQPDPF